VLTVVVDGAWGQLTFCGKSQYWFTGLNQKDPGQFWRIKIPSIHVKYEELKILNNFFFKFLKFSIFGDF
jgi:hypothetical protein